jgi:hypothetical protein
VSIAYLKSLYQRAPVLIDREIHIVGRVVSTDQFGAFYKNIVVEDPTGGIAIRVDMENYHRKYFAGDTYKIACNSLTISSYGGQLQLGTANGGYISDPHLPAVFTRGTPIAGSVPLRLTIGDIKPTHICRWVCFDGVQFEESGSWYSPEGRHIVDREGQRLVVRTSQHARFADEILPSGSGYIEGVLGVFNGTYQLEVWSESRAIMKNERF